jgi:hypothetical protein
VRWSVASGRSYDAYGDSTIAGRTRCACLTTVRVGHGFDESRLDGLFVRLGRE